MPEPNPNETRTQFINRCIQRVLQDGGASTQEQAIAMCHSLFDRMRQMENEKMKEQK